MLGLKLNHVKKGAPDDKSRRIINEIEWFLQIQYHINNTVKEEAFIDSDERVKWIRTKNSVSET